MKFDFKDILPEKQVNDKAPVEESSRFGLYKNIIDTMLDGKIGETEKLAINQNTADNHGST